MPVLCPCTPMNGDTRTNVTELEMASEWRGDKFMGEASRACSTIFFNTLFAATSLKWS